MNLNEKLTALRKEKGITQLQLAEKLDVSRQAVSRWEAGTAEPSTNNLKILSTLYGVTVDYLLCTNEDQDIPKETPKEKVSDVQTQDKKRSYKRYVIIMICVMAALILVMSYRAMIQEDSDHTTFGEMKSEQWEERGSDKLAVIW